MSILDQQNLMPWSTRFRKPIDLPDGRTLATLDDARAFIFTLKKEAQQSPEWQNAVYHLLKAADPPGAGPWIDFARIAMMQALLKDAPIKPRKKQTKKYKIVR